MKKISVVFIASLLFIPFVNAQDANPFFPQEDLMPIGAYYYPEHWKPEQWERDIKRMSELGFRFTHFAEFAWAKLEPEEGKFQFDWLDKNIELAHKNGLKVIMCTPSPTPPAWLTQKHPEILVVSDEGKPYRHGTRLHANAAHPTYQKYIKTIVEKLIERYGNDDRIWGWQIDNEPHFRGLYDYSGFAQQKFKKWLKKKYKTIDKLNQAWGTAFWSMTYNNFNQIRIPNAKETDGVNPHAILDFYRFNAGLLASALRFQAKLLEKNVSSKQWITTNYAYYKFLPSVDLFLNKNDLDFASHTMYLLSTYLDYPNDELYYRLGSGMGLSFSSEFARSVNGYTGIMELQPGQINWGAWNSKPLPGAVRMWVWHCFGLNDKFVCTYRFRQPLFGGEQFHDGIMETDGVTIAPGGKEYVQAINEIESLKKYYKKTQEIPPECKQRKTAFLWKQDNLFSMQTSPHTKSWDTWKHYYTYYLGIKRLGAPVTFIQESDSFDPDEYPFLIAPAYELVDKALVEKWKTYVEDGGNLILSCRTALKDKNGHLWEQLLQQPVWDLIGGKIAYYDQLPPTETGTISFEDKTYKWNIWADIIEPEKGTEVLAKHSSAFYKGKPCIIKKQTGKGTVTYIGAFSNNRQLEYQVLKKTYESAGANVLQLPEYVFTEWRDGFWITVNYTSETIQAPVHQSAEIIIGDKKIPPAGVCVWMEK